MSFVNSIATTKGGRHVDHVADLIVKNIIEKIKKTNKTGMQIKPFQVYPLHILIPYLLLSHTFCTLTFIIISYLVSYLRIYTYLFSCPYFLSNLFTFFSSLNNLHAFLLIDLFRIYLLLIYRLSYLHIFILTYFHTYFHTYLLIFVLTLFHTYLLIFIYLYTYFIIIDIIF